MESDPSVTASPNTHASAHAAELARTEILIANLLRGGVVLSAALLALGLVLTAIRPLEGFRAEDLAVLTKGGHLDAEAVPRTFASLSNGLAAFDAHAVLALGLIVLIALPIVRVGLTFVLFVKQRDTIYVLITGLVLAVLGVGLYLGTGA